ncbi:MULTISPECIES: hypothetical protein [unclassified Streptomyces]|uniref:hypothetical protein n=1 Tax=Streptomyces sp. NBC_00723 TaxID=2903673 RepID=UPI003870AF51
MLRQLCEHFDDLEAMSNVETRVAVELLIDTGRRPDEVLTLGYDCLQQDPGGSFVLVYDNHKAYRLRRRLPIGTETAATIRRQQQRVRECFPRTEPRRLTLLPRPRTNPEGTKPFKDISSAHRAWVDSLPDFLLPVTTLDAGEHVTRPVPSTRRRSSPMPTGTATPSGTLTLASRRTSSKS